MQHPSLVATAEHRAEHDIPTYRRFNAEQRLLIVELTRLSGVATTYTHTHTANALQTSNAPRYAIWRSNLLGETLGDVGALRGDRFELMNKTEKKGHACVIVRGWK